mmetsp:Transcript_30660/g.66930  ORF Transcript_30660/g.66930 Transcript_30660/m.66930 type:complete len:270 (+) Transcript_30660:522-1331(+)
MDCSSALLSSSEEMVPVLSLSMASNCCCRHWIPSRGTALPLISRAMARMAILRMDPVPAYDCSAESTAASSMTDLPLDLRPRVRIQGCSSAEQAEGRSPASRFSRDCTSAFPSGEMRSHSGRSKSGPLLQSTLRRMSFSVSPSKGMRPVRSMYAMTPTLHMSLSGPYSYRSTSGATKYAVPPARRSGRPGVNRRERPKSIALRTPSLPRLWNRKLSGLMSQMTTPFRWQCASARSICEMISATSASVKTPLQSSMRSYRSPPSHNSITR